jgi:hypothetical protein
MLILTLTTGVALPLIALVSIVLVPFSDKAARIQIAVSYLAYLGTVLHLAGMIA